MRIPVSKKTWPLATWYDERVPKQLVETARVFRINDRKRDQVHEQVVLFGRDPIFYLPDDAVVKFIYCTPKHPSHSDWESTSLLWVVRNDKKSWVTLEHPREIDKNQPVGTLILLDINEVHQLKSRARTGIWAAVEVARYETKTRSSWPAAKAVKNDIEKFLTSLEGKS